jgi:formylglycine-generating enzyme required for sulfatase activity
VTISKAFEMQTTEVTQSQSVAVMGSNPSYFQKSENCRGEFTTINSIPMCPNNPVEKVSWDDAQAFISKLNAKADGYRYRLPTEA